MLRFLRNLIRRNSARILDTARRASKTFAQTFVSTLGAGLSGIVHLRVSVVLAAVVAAGASAVSVAWNTVVKPALPLLVVVHQHDDPPKPLS